MSTIFLLAYITLAYLLQAKIEEVKNEKKKKVKRDPKLAVPTPTPTGVRSGVLKTKRVRSLAKRREKELSKARALAGKFKMFAQVIRVPFSLESLKKTLTTDEEEELEAICDNKLGPSQESQCLSAQFVDKNGKPILFYFGERIVRVGEDPPVKYMFCFFLLVLIYFSRKR